MTHEQTLEHAIKECTSLVDLIDKWETYKRRVMTKDDLRKWIEVNCKITQKGKVRPLHYQKLLVLL